MACDERLLEVVGREGWRSWAMLLDGGVGAKPRGFASGRGDEGRLGPLRQRDRLAQRGLHQQEARARRGSGRRRLSGPRRRQFAGVGARDRRRRPCRWRGRAGWPPCAAAAACGEALDHARPAPPAGAPAPRPAAAPWRASASAPSSRRRFRRQSTPCPAASAWAVVGIAGRAQGGQGVVRGLQRVGVGAGELGEAGDQLGGTSGRRRPRPAHRPPGRRRVVRRR